MYIKQEQNKISLFQSIPSDDRDKRILSGSKEEIQDIVLLLQSGIKNFKYKILTDID